MTNNILLITGNTGVGKDTLAQNVKNCSELKFCPHIYSFGDSLKAFTSELYNIPKEEFYTNKEGLNCNYIDYLSIPRRQLTNRELLQQTSDKVKKYNQTFFTDITLANIEDVPFIIFPDWRFPYELTRLRGKFPNAKIRTIRLKTDKVRINNHNSDDSLDGYITDFELDNARLSPQQTCEITIKRVKNWFLDLFN